MLSTIWSNRAIDELEKILRYLIKRNGNIDYSLKIENFSINKHSLQAIFGIPGVLFY